MIANALSLLHSVTAAAEPGSEGGKNITAVTLRVLLRVAKHERCAQDVITGLESSIHRSDMVGRDFTTTNTLRFPHYNRSANDGACFSITGDLKLRAWYSGPFARDTVPKELRGDAGVELDLRRASPAQIAAFVLGFYRKCLKAYNDYNDYLASELEGIQ